MIDPYRYKHGEQLLQAYDRASRVPCDINEHLSVIQHLASQCSHVTEMGVRHGISTLALLSGFPGEYIGYDISRPPAHLQVLAEDNGIQYTHIVGDTTKVPVIDRTDLLLIDTRHTYWQLHAELNRHGASVAKFIVLHDTVTFGEVDEFRGTGGGLIKAYTEYLRANPDWEIGNIYTNNNGLTVLKNAGFFNNLSNKKTPVS